MFDTEDLLAGIREDKEKKAKFDQEMWELRKTEFAKKGVIIKEALSKTKEEEMREFFGWAEHPNTIENSTATVFWIAAMIVSLLFKGGWVLCIIETVIWWKFITRHI